MASILDMMNMQRSPLVGLLGAAGGPGDDLTQTPQWQAAQPSISPQALDLQQMQAGAVPGPGMPAAAPGGEDPFMAAMQAPGPVPLGGDSFKDKVGAGITNLVVGDRPAGLDDQQWDQIKRGSYITAGLTMLAQPAASATQAMAVGIMMSRQQSAETAGQLLDEQATQNRISRRLALFEDGDGEGGLDELDKMSMLRRIALAEGDTEGAKMLTEVIQDIRAANVQGLDVVSINGRDVLMDTEGNIFEPGTREPIRDSVREHLTMPNELNGMMRVLGLDPDNLSPTEQAFTLQWWRQHKESGAARSTTNVQVDSGPIPPGWRVVRGPDGQVQEMEMVPGGPAEREYWADMAQVAQQQALTLQAAGTVTEDVDRALEILRRHGHAAAGIGGLGAAVVGTPGRDLRDLIESLQSNIAVDRLLQIKSTGAGLGQIPHDQMLMLAGTLGSLSPTMSPRELEFNLERIGGVYREIIADLYTPAPEYVPPAGMGAPAPAGGGGPRRDPAARRPIDNIFGGNR